jgi:hypothetical protein
VWRIADRWFDWESDISLERNARGKIMQYDVAKFFNKVCLGMTKIKKIIFGFRTADVCLLTPEMFTEIEFETNEEKSRMTNKEYERDKCAAASVTTAAQGSIEIYHLNHNLISPEL